MLDTFHTLGLLKLLSENCARTYLPIDTILIAGDWNLQFHGMALLIVLEVKVSTLIARELESIENGKYADITYAVR